MHPSARTPTPKTITRGSVVANTKIQPRIANTAGTGYSHMRYGLGMSGWLRLSRMRPAACPMNCTMMRVTIIASMTVPSEKKPAMMEMAPSTSSDTYGKCFVGCRRPKTLKKYPVSAAANGMRE